MSQPFDVEAEFAKALNEAYENDLKKAAFPPEEWFKGGRGKEDLAWWQENGAQYVQNFIDWYESRDDVKVWITPDGEPAIELGLNVNFGEIPVVMYVDLVIEMGKPGNEALVIVDYKSGSTKPKSHRQQAVYACGIEKAYGIRPRYGSYFMCRGGKSGDEFFLQPVELSAAQYSYEYMSGLFEQAERGIVNNVFPANPGDSCRTCVFAYACTEVHGEMAPQLDPNFPSWQ